MGFLGLSGSLVLGLLVFDFYHPTNCVLYLVVEAAVAAVVEGVAVAEVGRILYLHFFLVS